jgi:hypothetical protein
MRKLSLAICLLAVSATFAAAQSGTYSSAGHIKNPPRHHGHAPEMSTTAMVVAGVIGLGGYLLIRRRISLPVR